MKKFLLFISIAFLFAVKSFAVPVAGADSVCAGEKATYYVPYVSGAAYSWSITGGTILSGNNTDSLVIQWGAAGTGTITVLQTNPNATYTLTVSIFPNPNPQITHAPYPTCPQDTGGGSTGQLPDHGKGCEKVCKLSTITYCTQLNSGSTYVWTVSGALNISGANTNCATVTWDSTMAGILVVVETNQWGCSDSAEICVEKVDLPVASFTHQANACKFSNVLFNNTSSGATSYQWYFGDGGSSTQTHPTHAYSTAGSFTITLIAMNDCYCTDTFQSVINIDSLPGPTITCPSTLCAFDTATYTASNAGVGCVYNWFVIGGTILSGQGTPNITVAWGAGQLGTLGLYITGCSPVCSDTTLVYIPIVPSVATIIGPNKVCPGDCETYSLPVFSGATYTWSLSGACGGVLTDSTCCEKVEICWPPFPMTCNDTLTVSFYDSFLRCGGSGQIVIRMRPRLEILGNNPACSNQPATYSAVGGYNCFWSISPAGPFITPGSTPNATVNWLGNTGTYVITAVPQIPNQVCNDSAFIIVKVIAAPPTPVITGDTIVCPNTSVSYCATASGTVNWIITGGTPTTSIGNCVTVTWGNIPPYIVQAYQQMPNSPYCSSDTATQNVYAASATPPIVNALGVVCANGNTSFGCANCGLYPAGTTYAWSVNPSNAGAVVSGQGTSAATIQWGNNAPQNVTVTLTATVCGNPLPNSVIVSLNPAPTPSVNQLSNLCAGGTAQLQAVGGVFTGFNWSGPSGYSSVVNPTTISLAGLYQVTVTDANLCTALSQKNVQYVGGPNASISTLNPLNYCIGASYTVFMCALGNGSYSYLWSNAAFTQCISVGSPGSYNVTVTDANACTAVSNTIVVTEDTCGGTGNPCIPGPGSVSFTTSGCNPVSFTNTSVNASSFTWNFGDLTFSNLTSPTHAYTQAGLYLVTLSGYVPNNTGTDSCLLQDTAHIEIPLAADFFFTSGCNGTPVCFTDNSSFTVGNNITGWSWNFGDANTSTLQNPCHTYSGPGTYIVTLTITNGSCTTSHTDTVVIANPPVAAFTFSNPNCVNQPVNFTDASTGGVNYWNWAFGDAGTSLNQNPSHTYILANTYPVMLIVKDTSGCADTVQQNVTVVAPSLSGSITAFPDTIVCSGTQVLLVAPTCGSCTYLWSNGSTNDSIVVTTTGIYSVTLTDANGCPYSTLITILVNNGPPAIIVNSGKDELCLGEFTSLSVPWNINWTYQWISNDVNANGATSSGVSVFPAVPGTYNYQVVITDTTTGCSDTSLPYIIIVHPNPLPPTITPLTSTTVCKGDTILLLGSHPDPTVIFLWSNGSIDDTLYAVNNGCYNLQVTDTNGCKASASYCVTVNPLPELCSFYQGCFDTCAPYTVCAPNGIAWQWLNNNVPMPGDTMQCLTTSMSGNYSVIVTNIYGCIDTTGTLDLTLYPCPDSLCADFWIDSVACDSNGNYIMYYHVANQSQIPVTQVNLEILQPNLNVPFAPAVVFTNIPSQGISQQLTTTIYNANPGDSLCFRVHILAFDSMGHEEICCYSDTDCVVLDTCDEKHTDTLCCYFNYLGDSIWCTQSPNGIIYNFNLYVNGCGTLTMQSGNNTIINGNNPLMLNGSTAIISGTYTPTGASDTTICITFIMSSAATPPAICADTTICISFNCKHSGVPTCILNYDDSICVGQTSIFQYGGNPTGLTFTWQFTNGTPNSASGPGPHTVTFNTPGCHLIVLIINNNLPGTVDCVDSICVFPPPVASISQNGNSLFAFPAGYSYQWYNGFPGGSPIAGAVNQFYNPPADGFYCVIVSNGAGCEDTACIDAVGVGINELNENNWSIFPNPNDGSFTLSIEGVKSETAEVKVLNALGEVVDLRIFETKSGKQNFFIANKNFATGIYFIQLKTQNGVGLKRMMVR